MMTVLAGLDDDAKRPAEDCVQNWLVITAIPGDDIYVSYENVVTIRN
jgi:hypothetical protein